MEYLEGETLDDRLLRGPLVPDELMRLGSEISAGLESAHRAGLVHRDLKPANVMLTPTGAKILDFGLARGVAGDPGESDPEAPTELALTSEGMIVGTTPYMAPEQLHGEPADTRTDVWALGCILFEMATGTRPFTGPTRASVIGSIVGMDPGPPSRKRSQLPEGLDGVVMGCLEKDPERRWQSTSEVREGLEAVGLAPEQAVGDAADDSEARQRGKTVVVLPFANRSPDPENEYFSDGLTEEVISDLASVDALRVISRNSAMALKGTSKGTADLAEELGVTHLVTGAVRRVGDALRVTAELVEAATDVPIWTEKYTGTAADVFAIQEEISQKIVAALEVRLTASEVDQVTERAIEDPVAFDCYLRARQQMYLWTPEASRRALKLVDDALAIVGDNALLLATKGQIHWIAANALLGTADEALEFAELCADRAIELDPGTARGVFVRGLAQGARGDVEGALESLMQAHLREPGDANISVELCRFANAAGLRNQGSLIDDLVKVDPLTPVTHLVVSTYSSVNGRFEEGAAAARRAAEMTPGASLFHGIAAWQIAEAGYLEEAVGMLERIGSSLGEGLARSWALFSKAAMERDAEAALPHLTQEMERSIGDHLAHMIVQGLALLGLQPEAVRWSAIAVKAGFINYPCLAVHDPFLAQVRQTPDFQRLLADLRPRWEAAVEWESEQGWT
jgi:TolB-like protein